MSDIFIAYARSTAAQAQRIAEALRGLGYDVWLDDELPAHRAYAEVIEERLKAAKAVVVIWSAEAVKSEWVQSEADRGRELKKLVQLSVDGAKLPMPFDRIQCADLAGWAGDLKAPGWRKVIGSIADLMGAEIAETSTPPPLALPSKPSIAVLPFANLSGDPEQDYFADGMVEEITAALSRIKSIFVIGSGAGLSFKGGTTAPREVGRVLGVRYVLEGSVRKAGARVRIAVKLIDATDGAQIWTGKFEDTLEDVFALQDTVALSVAGVIEPTIQTAEIRRASMRPTDNMSSYDLYLRGLSHYRLLEKAEMLAALDLFEGAVTLDPDFGPAMGSAIVCHGNIIINGWSDDLEGHVREALSLMRRAVRVGSDDPDVLMNLALGTLMTAGDLEVAGNFADRAMALNPGSANVWFTSGMVRLQSGKPELAFQHYETALRLDPRSPYLHVLWAMQGTALFAQRRFAEAVPLLKQSAQLMPGWPFSYSVLAAIYGHMGDTLAAREAIARLKATSDADPSNVTWPEPEVRKLLIDGIALAEGKNLAGAEGAP